MQKLLAPRIERAHELASITFPDPSDKTKAVVRSATHLDKEYETDITAKTCECGMPVIEKGPCKHLIFHAKSIGKPLSWLLGSKDSLEGYEAQYPADLEYLVPTEAEVISQFGNLIDSNVRLPLVVRRKAGRPVVKRKKSAIERFGGTKRAKATCSKCGNEGHTSRKCHEMRGSGAILGAGAGGSG